MKLSEICAAALTKYMEEKRTICGPDFVGRVIDHALARPGSALFTAITMFIRRKPSPLQ